MHDNEDDCDDCDEKELRRILKKRYDLARKELTMKICHDLSDAPQHSFYGDTNLCCSLDRVTDAVNMFRMNGVAVFHHVLDRKLEPNVTDLALALMGRTDLPCKLAYM